MIQGPIVDTSAISFFPILLPTCIFLLAVDVAVRISHRSVRPGPSTIHHTACIPEHHDPLKTLAARANQVFLDFQYLERRLAVEKGQSRQLSLIIPARPTIAIHTEIIKASNTLIASARSGRLSRAYTLEAAEAIKNRNLDGAFMAFCERLLLMNRIWKQEREIRDLRVKARSVDSAKCSNAFRAFCDRIILSNRVWRLEKQVNTLVEETAKMRRSRIAAVTRAAKKMVLDVRKERLVEEFVKDLLVDVEEGKQTIAALREDHEREIREIMSDWRRDYAELMREVERLRLGREASRLEQELSNELEQTLLDQLNSMRRKVDEFEDSSVPIFPTRTRFTGDDDETLSGDLDDIANLSSSTCVSSGNHEFRKGSAMANASRRRRSTNNPRKSLSMLRIPLRTTAKRRTPHVSPSISSPLRKLDTSPFVGFSFNPLFFGHPESTSNKAGQYASKSEGGSGEVAHGHCGRPISTRQLMESNTGAARTSTRDIAADSTQPPKRTRTDPWKF